MSNFISDVVSGWLNKGQYNPKQASQKFEQNAGAIALKRHQSVDQTRLQTEVYTGYADRNSERAIWREHSAQNDKVDIDFSKHN